MTELSRSVLLIASTVASPALAQSGYMGVPTSTSIGGFLIGAALLIGVAAVAGAAYGALRYLIDKIRGRA